MGYCNLLRHGTVVAIAIVIVIAISATIMDGRNATDAALPVDARPRPPRHADHSADLQVVRR